MFDRILNTLKSPVKLNSFFSKFFVISPGLIRRDTGRLANEAFTSDLLVCSKQWLTGLKITNCSCGSLKIEYDHSGKTYFLVTSNE